jgi:hypothetical protein
MLSPLGSEDCECVPGMLTDCMFYWFGMQRVLTRQGHCV